jgi:desampylase
MGLYLSRTHHAQLLEWAQHAAPQECCGLLLGTDGLVSAVVSANNVAADPHLHFEIDPGALITAHKQARAGGPGIIGYFHSHPNGRERPSFNDMESAAPDGRYWLIIANGEISAWLPVVQTGAETGFRPVALTVQG